jgi:acetolactate synthase-1/2/3 large subunit
MKNVELIARMLAESGVRWVFGVPSGPVLPLIDALRCQDGIEFVLTASETSAGFMATSVSQLTGRPGACVATVGPGATNLATGVGAAWLDRAPVIAFTCNVPSDWLDRRIQMRIDHHALFRPLTKATLPLRAHNVGETLNTALNLACAEPPGPVHLDLPEDVGLAPAFDLPRAPAPPAQLPDVAQPVVAAIQAALQRYRRPIVVTGLSFTRASAAQALLRFVEKQQLPFVSTLHAKGFLPEGHPNWAGVIERARRTDLRRLIQSADLVIALGYDPIEVNYEDWIGSVPLMHVDGEAADVRSPVQVLLNAAGDLDSVIRRLAELPATPHDWSAQELADHRAALERALRPPCDSLAPHDVLDVLREKLPADGILAYDVGAHTHQIATQWRTDLPRTCNATNGWSSMGFGMPAAYAAKLVHPDRSVVAVVGDGCFK